jgi:hypothetical protein
MKFIPTGEKVRIQIQETLPSGEPVLHADFKVRKAHFEEFLDHIVAECKKAYQRDELFT